jgi:hypothetical protein
MGLQLRSLHWLVVIALACAPSAVVFADDDGEDEKPIRKNSWFSSERSNDELAIDLTHPVGKLFTVAGDIEQRPMQGNLPDAGAQTTTDGIVTTSYPFVLNNGKSIILRASIPIKLDQPTYVADSGEYIEWRIRQVADTLERDGHFFTVHDHMYDISYDIAYGGVSDSGFISMYGIAGVFPTSQDGSVERDQYLLGPEVAFGQVRDWGVYGVWAQHLTNVADVTRKDNEFDSNLTHLKFFFAWGLGNGWQIISNPVITYDWEAADDNQLYLPLGAGVSKTFRLGRMPWKMDLEIQNYIESPEAFGPEWLFSFRLTPVFQDLAWK